MSTGLLFKFANQGKATPIRFNFRHTTRHLRLKLSDWMINEKSVGTPTMLATSSAAPVLERLRTEQSNPHLRT